MQFSAGLHLAKLRVSNGFFGVEEGDGFLLSPFLGGYIICSRSAQWTLQWNPLGTLFLFEICLLKENKEKQLSRKITALEERVWPRANASVKVKNIHCNLDVSRNDAQSYKLLLRQVTNIKIGVRMQSANIVFSYLRLRQCSWQTLVRKQMILGSFHK